MQNYPQARGVPFNHYIRHFCANLLDVVILAFVEHVILTPLHAVHGWHGLLEDWKQLAQPSFLDMIPWHWPVIKPEHSKPAPYNTLMLFNFLVTITS
jgi:hypothetical protein